MEKGEKRDQRGMEGALNCVWIFTKKMTHAKKPKPSLVQPSLRMQLHRQPRRRQPTADLHQGLHAVTQEDLVHT